MITSRLHGGVLKRSKCTQKRVEASNVKIKEAERGLTANADSSSVIKILSQPPKELTDRLAPIPVISLNESYISKKSPNPLKISRYISCSDKKGKIPANNSHRYYGNL